MMPGITVGKIFATSEMELVSIVGGDIPLTWVIVGGHLLIIVDNKTGKLCSYWYQVNIGTFSEGNTGSLINPMTTIADYPVTDHMGFEIHFGLVDDKTGWSSVWLQYAKKKLVGHYIKY
jgi:hypothetical protein